MNYRFLGSSGLEVSELCFGAMTFTGTEGWTHLGESGQKEADRITAHAIDRGINFFDTANVYSEGISEEILGKALGKNRKDVVLATKCGLKMSDNPNGNGLSRKHILDAVDASLTRLNTDYIDVLYTHSVDFIVPFEETMSTLDMLVKQGKVRYLACSNYFAWQLMKAGTLCDKHGWEKFVGLQAYYSLLGRDIEFEIVDACREQGIGILPWSPLHGGILTGKYRRKDKNNWPEGTRLTEPGHHLPYDVKKGERILDEMEKISERRGVSMSQVALNYLLRKPFVSSIVIGARNMEQLNDNIDTVTWELNEEEMKKLDELSALPVYYPQWYFDIWRKERRVR